MTADLSVIVVSLNSLQMLPQCLAALDALADPGMDIVVVRDWHSAGGSKSGLVERFPCVRWIDAPVATTVPLLRWHGMRAATGAFVALIEDDCLVRRGWSQAVRAALAGGATAVGGAVEPGPYRSWRDWGVYFCEYGRFMPPLIERETADLAGMNVAYPRHALDGIAAWPDGFHDRFVHWAWQREGRTMLATNTFVVQNVNAWRADHVTSSPYHHGRAFAARRFADTPAWRRVGFAIAAAVLLPALKTVRIAGVVAGRRRHRRRFVAALPWVLLFNAAWTCGEVIGCLRGPGSSAERWR